ncbi:MAG: GNAT family N-acetyltransferase [Saccharofermentanales bacterium]
MIHFVLPDESYEKQYLEMMEEWTQFGGRLNPEALMSHGATYQDWLERTESNRYAENCPKDWVPQTVYFAVDESNHLVGAAAIRDHLSEQLMINGGHVGYGVRPSQRRKGYAKEMLALAVRILKDRGIQDILVTCASDNAGSERTILANGGVLDNEGPNRDGEMTKRFWIHL